jgi:hypothetical protein
MRLCEILDQTGIPQLDRMVRITEYQKNLLCGYAADEGALATVGQSRVCSRVVSPLFDDTGRVQSAPRHHDVLTTQPYNKQMLERRIRRRHLQLPKACSKEPLAKMRCTRGGAHARTLQKPVCNKCI